jgi:hypothetical protein
MDMVMGYHNIKLSWVIDGPSYISENYKYYIEQVKKILMFYFQWPNLCQITGNLLC